jgi:Sel1 repeat
MKPQNSENEGPEVVHGSEIADLIAKAEAGNPDAQRNLAIRLHGGEGIQQDRGAATIWLKRAAEGGDAWAQTTFAIQLRVTKEPENERESVRWLSLAAEQGDPRARFNLGLQQLSGIGTPIDLESSVVNFMMASLAGFDDARKCFDLARPAVPEGSWERVFNRVKWPLLTILMGPLTKGHLDGIRQSQENDEGSDGAVWLEYEREVARTMFSSSGHDGSILDSAFGEPIIVDRFFVGRAIVADRTVAAITINLRNVTLRNRFPVYWKPTGDAMNAATALIGFLEGRDWVRHSYISF